MWRHQPIWPHANNVLFCVVCLHSTVHRHNLRLVQHMDLMEYLLFVMDGCPSCRLSPLSMYERCQGSKLSLHAVNGIFLLTYRSVLVHTNSIGFIIKI